GGQARRQHDQREEAPGRTFEQEPEQRRNHHGCSQEADGQIAFHARPRTYQGAPECTSISENSCTCVARRRAAPDLRPPPAKGTPRVRGASFRPCSAGSPAFPENSRRV